MRWVVMRRLCDGKGKWDEWGEGGGMVKERSEIEEGREGEVKR